MTSNFDFVRATWPTVHGDCARAESYLSSTAEEAHGSVSSYVGVIVDIPNDGKAHAVPSGVA